MMSRSNQTSFFLFENAGEKFRVKNFNNELIGILDIDREELIISGGEPYQVRVIKNKFLESYHINRRTEYGYSVDIGYFTLSDKI